MKQKLLTILLTLLPLMVSADDSGQCGRGVTYKFEENTHTLIISKTSDGYGDIDSFDDDGNPFCPWESYKTEIFHIIMEYGITYFGEFVFEDCCNLLTVSIPITVTAIEPRVFRNCSSLTSLTIPSTVNYIGKEAFRGCTSLTEIFMRSSEPPVLGNNAFPNNSIAINVPLGCKDVYKSAEGWGVFNNINEVTYDNYMLIYLLNGNMYKSFEMKMGESITPEPILTKEGYSFSGWSEIPETMPAHDVIVEGKFTINKYKLIFMIDGSEYESYEIEYGKGNLPVPNPWKENCSFSGWSEIPETMPAHDVIVTGSFTKFATDIDGVKYLFDGDKAIVTNCNPVGNVNIVSTFEDNGKIYTVTKIAENAFRGNMNISSVIIPNTVTNIGEYAFQGCRKIETIEIGSGIYTIGERAFADIDKLTDVTCYADNVPETDRTAFEHSYLDYVTLHVPYKSINDYKSKGPWKDFKEITPIHVDLYTLTYLVDGVEYKVYNIPSGEQITSEAEPTKEGYTFSGWSEIPETMPANDVIVTGKFTINKYKITYIIDGEVYLSEEVEYGSTITPPNPGDHEGYDFAWEDYPDTMPAHDITINGTYITTGIEAIFASERDVKIFTVSGKPLNKVQKGVNILRYKDGRTRKIVVK